MSEFPHTAYQMNEILKRQNRLRALSDMPRVIRLERALHILASVHTRDNVHMGFVVETDPRSDAYGSVTQREYVDAWRIVRRYLHMQTEPAD